MSREMGHTDFAGGIGHRADDFCGRQDHRLELRNGHPGQNADQQFPIQGFLHPRLAQDLLGYLWLAAGGSIRTLRAWAEFM